MTPTVKTYIEKLEELLKIQEKSFVYEMTGEGSGLDWNNEFIPLANKLKDEIASLKQQIEAEENTFRSDERIDPEADKQAFGSGWETIK